MRSRSCKQAKILAAQLHNVRLSLDETCAVSDYCPQEPTDMCSLCTVGQTQRTTTMGLLPASPPQHADRIGVAAGGARRNRLPAPASEPSHGAITCSPLVAPLSFRRARRSCLRPPASMKDDLSTRRLDHHALARTGVPAHA